MLFMSRTVLSLLKVTVAFVTSGHYLTTPTVYLSLDHVRLSTNEMQICLAFVFSCICVSSRCTFYAFDSFPLKGVT